MALARRRCCYSIERLLRGLHQILSPFPSPPASPAPFPPGPPPSSSSSSTFSHPPPLVAAQRHTHTHAEGKRREERIGSSLSAGHAAGLPSPSFPSEAFSWPDDVPTPWSQGGDTLPPLLRLPSSSSSSSLSRRGEERRVPWEIRGLGRPLSLSSLINIQETPRAGPRRRRRVNSDWLRGDISTATRNRPAYTFEESGGGIGRTFSKGERERDSSRPPPPPGGERRDRRDREEVDDAVAGGGIIDFLGGQVEWLGFSEYRVGVGQRVSLF